MKSETAVELNHHYEVHFLFVATSKSRAWCKTIATTIFSITGYNSFAPSPRNPLYTILKHFSIGEINIIWGSPLAVITSIAIQSQESRASSFSFVSIYSVQNS